MFVYSTDTTQPGNPPLAPSTSGNTGENVGYSLVIENLKCTRHVLFTNFDFDPFADVGRPMPSHSEMTWVSDSDAIGSALSDQKLVYTDSFWQQDRDFVAWLNRTANLRAGANFW